ncbi:6-carboxytetrahydropterin synthase QueD [Bacillus sp. V2I10]|jgi:6-pyruvoyltetrahydropterin/6-carboxytetrahydropterin synthase|uniref:6-carboxytetrahydropterin synthase QueD n=1 Tax=Bacillus sp. V2I10 TaxID=3042276 RepID=UPI0027876553|nr:6-carboxytetrahydropterin synthase QueD [Bacillus sp. V2I10]MDQ0860516.1 6-pyruvoyltetrahydropterin/6-carboxytetrahydropterin synthase [Bacillus sp. V2I10]
MLQQMYPQTLHPYSYELNKDMQISAAHYVPNEEAGKCRRIHGHTYFINVTVAGDELDQSGFLINFAHIKELVHDRFDHTILNENEVFDDHDPNKFPTTEVVARTIYEIIQQHLDTLGHKPKCVGVFVRETPTSYVMYRPKQVKNG